MSTFLCEYDTIEPSSMLYQGQQVMNERSSFTPEHKFTLFSQELPFLSSKKIRVCVAAVPFFAINRFNRKTLKIIRSCWSCAKKPLSHRSWVSLFPTRLENIRAKKFSHVIEKKSALQPPEKKKIRIKRRKYSFKAIIKRSFGEAIK